MAGSDLSGQPVATAWQGRSKARAAPLSPRRSPSPISARSSSAAQSTTAPCALHGFIAYAIQDWLAAAGIKTMYIKPGSPWENGHIESFPDKLRDECLNRELFRRLAEARVILEGWKLEYNERRPHSALGCRTPNEYHELQTNLSDGACAAPTPAPLAAAGVRGGT